MAANTSTSDFCSIIDKTTSAEALIPKGKPSLRLVVNSDYTHFFSSCSTSNFLAFRPTGANKFLPRQ